MTAPLAKTAFTQTWMALAVRAIERSGPLDDADALAEAMRLHPQAQQRQERLRERAWLLGQRLGLDTHLAYVLASRGVRTLEDLAEQSIDELMAIDGMDEARAGELIMAARNICWFGEAGN